MDSEVIKDTSFEQELQTTEKNVFRVQKVLKTKDDKLGGKWNVYEYCFNDWVNKSDVIEERFVDKSNEKI